MEGLSDGGGLHHFAFSIDEHLDPIRRKLLLNERSLWQHLDLQKMHRDSITILCTVSLHCVINPCNEATVFTQSQPCNSGTPSCTSFFCHY